MTRLRQAAADYLQLRRGLGFSLVRDEKLLSQFLGWLEDQDTDTITVTQALAWAQLPGNASAGWLSFRLQVVRGFATYLHTLDPAVEVPPPDLLRHSHRAVPYLYTDADIAALFAQAERLRTPLRTATLQTLIGLLAVTGMRIGEAIGLDDDDVDAQTGVILVRHAKFGKQRLIPLHPSTLAALTRYRTLRDLSFPTPSSTALLVSSAGTRLHYVNVSQTFVKLARRAGLTQRSGSCRPRPHDLRHVVSAYDVVRGS